MGAVRLSEAPHPFWYKRALDIPQNPHLRKWLEGLSTSDLDGGKFTIADIREMMRRLVRNEVKYENVIASVHSRSNEKHHKPEKVKACVSEFLSYLPAHLQMALHGKKLNVDLQVGTIEYAGEYQDGTVILNANMIPDEDSLRRVVFHEMAHWVHEVSPLYQQSVAKHFNERTRGYPESGKEPLRRSGASGDVYDSEKVKGVRDDFGDISGDEYAGRVYNGKLKGMEIPSTCLQWLADPKILLGNLNHMGRNKRHSGRESFLVAVTVLF